MTQGWFLFVFVGMFWSHSLYSELSRSLLYTKRQLNNFVFRRKRGPVTALSSVSPNNVVRLSKCGGLRNWFRR